MSNFLKLVNGVPRAGAVNGTDIASGLATSTQVLAANGSGGSAFRSLASGDIPSLSSIYLALANYRAGKTAISSSGTSVVVTFSSALSSTSYSVAANMLNVTDSNPQFQPITITAQSTTGFTAKWNMATLSGNYLLSWQAIINN